jgi:hypothetical protein
VVSFMLGSQSRHHNTPLSKNALGIAKGAYGCRLSTDFPLSFGRLSGSAKCSRSNAATHSSHCRSMLPTFSHSQHARCSFYFRAKKPQSNAPTTFQIDCNGLEALNSFPFVGSEPGTLSVCSFDATLSLSTGVTGNYFEGHGAPSPWTGNVEVEVINHTQSNSKRKILGVVRVNGCRLNFKDRTVEPPVILANSSMQCGWKQNGMAGSVLFTSHDGSQTVKIVNRESDHRDDTWPFFCQVDNLFFVSFFTLNSRAFSFHAKSASRVCASSPASTRLRCSERAQSPSRFTSKTKSTGARKICPFFFGF